MLKLEILFQHTETLKVTYLSPFFSSTVTAAYSAYQHDASSEEDEEEPLITGLWTDEESTVLVRLIKKYPAGTTDRWETIAKTMRRPLPQVTKMAEKLKNDTFTGKVSASVQGITGNEDTSHVGISSEVTEKDPENGPIMIGDYEVQMKKEKKKKDKATVDVKNVESWSQEQQQALELALKENRKGTDGRWDKVANRVPGKSKEECMARFTYLADMVRKKKAEKENPTAEESEKVEDNEEV